jgi:phosphoglycolate phosphatase-like HAD superfamily hydrolase
MNKMAEHPEAARPLAEMKPRRGFFVGIDSDGCAFDTMEPKHKECFCPNFVKWFHLESVSKYAREGWDFVNLYSRDRGCNRWLALLKVLDLLRERPEVAARKVQIPEYGELRKFAASGLPLSNDGLKQYMAAHSHPELETAWNWTVGVNQSVKELVRHVPPYPFVRESLEKLAPVADIVVVSATPTEALDREWAEHGLAKHTRVIAGQEMGTKAEHLKLAAHGKYPKEKILMIGDAEGDLKAARSIGALFFPVNPGHEESSWKLFCEEAFEKFVKGRFAGAYEAQLIRKFRAYLPEVAPWKAAGRKKRDPGSERAPGRAGPARGGRRFRAR